VLSKSYVMTTSTQYHLFGHTFHVGVLYKSYGIINGSPDIPSWHTIYLGVPCPSYLTLSIFTIVNHDIRFAWECLTNRRSREQYIYPIIATYHSKLHNILNVLNQLLVVFVFIQINSSWHTIEMGLLTKSYVMYNKNEKNHSIYSCTKLFHTVALGVLGKS